jgi:hypothetical protein
VGNAPTTVMELVTDQLLECRLGGTLVEHPLYYFLKVLTRPSFSSHVLLPIKLVPSYSIVKLMRVLNDMSVN